MSFSSPVRVLSSDAPRGRGLGCVFRDINRVSEDIYLHLSHSK